jgi:hypothetical protein
MQQNVKSALVRFFCCVRRTLQGSGRNPAILCAPWRQNIEGKRCRLYLLRYVEAGVPITMVGNLAGWSANSMITMATRYSHHGVDSLRLAMEAAGNANPATNPPEATTPISSKLQ